jgi:hypothetical protein
MKNKKKKNRKYWVEYNIECIGSVEVTASSKEDARDKFCELSFEEMLKGADRKTNINIDDVVLIPDDK